MPRNSTVSRISIHGVRGGEGMLFDKERDEEWWEHEKKFWENERKMDQYMVAFFVVAYIILGLCIFAISLILYRLLFQ